MGAICPQRRISKTRKRQRRSHFKLDNPSMMVCPNCGEIKLSHVVCSACGYYGDRVVKAVKVKDEDEKVEETKPNKKSSKKTSEKVEGEKEVKTKKTKKTKPVEE